jgi:hypothetical protein
LHQPTRIPVISYLPIKPPADKSRSSYLAKAAKAHFEPFSIHAFKLVSAIFDKGRTTAAGREGHGGEHQQ